MFYTAAIVTDILVFCVIHVALYWLTMQVPCYKKPYAHVILMFAAGKLMVRIKRSSSIVPL